MFVKLQGYKRIRVGVCYQAKRAQEWFQEAKAAPCSISGGRVSSIRWGVYKKSSECCLREICNHFDITGVYSCIHQVKYAEISREWARPPCSRMGKGFQRQTKRSIKTISMCQKRTVPKYDRFIAWRFKIFYRYDRFSISYERSKIVPFRRAVSGQDFTTTTNDNSQVVGRCR